MFIQYAHILGIEPGDVMAEYESMFSNLDKVEDQESLEHDQTNYKFALYVVNPYHAKYFGPLCRNCGKKGCHNCPLPIQ